MENHMNPKSRLNIAPKTLETAASGAKEALEGAQSKLGFIPNLYGNHANSPGALSTYFHGYEQFRSRSGFTPAEQEVVLLTVSRENECGYCIAAHSMVAEKMSAVPPQAVTAIRDGNAIHDRKLAALADFTRRLLQSRGHPTVPEVQAFLSAGFREEQILEVVLAIAVKTISNYTNHLFDTPVDSVFSAYAWPENK